jgi:hypothetical protein
MDKSSTDEIHTDDENHSMGCIADTLKKVSIDESKNTVQQLPISGSQGGVLPLKPDTPKIAVKQWTYKFLLTDTLTDSVVGLYPTNKAATLVAIELVKKDLISYVNDFQLKILKGESIEENRMYLANIKHLTYQYNTIEQSLNTSITIDNKTTSRFKILCLREDNSEVDESDYVMI